MTHRGLARPALASLLLAACGSPTLVDRPDVAAPRHDDTAPHDDAAPPDDVVTPDAGVVPPPPGWTLSDETPHARLGHAAILDEGADRMIVYGGPANDTWALPLSGPRANRWTKLVPAGDYPPPRAQDDSLSPANTAIYDPFGKRMLVLVNGWSVARDPELWELSLEGPLRWRRIQTSGPAPGSELGVGKMVLDRAGKRAVVIGASWSTPAVRTLALEGEPRWTRLDGHPPAPLLLDGAVYAVDAQRNQVVLFGGLPGDGTTWAMSLATGDWSALDKASTTFVGFGSAAVTDEAHDRVVLIGDSSRGLSTFSLATHAWSSVPVSSGSPQETTAVVDVKRRRVILFSGLWDSPDDPASPPRGLTDATWAVSLDTLQLAELVPAQHGNAPPMDGLNTIWDPTRRLVVSFGTPTSDVDNRSTWGHGLANGDVWQHLPVPEAAPPSRAATIYDPVGQAIISFGGYQYPEQKDVLRLSSAPGATWEKLVVEDGPAERSRHVGVYDEVRRRLVTFGGWRNSSYPPAEVLTDTWALSLEGGTRWTRLPTTGRTPTTPIGAVGIYDAPRDRMLVYGGTDGQTAATGTVIHALSFGDALAWTELGWTGAAPEMLERATAIYDAARERMILVDLRESGAVVYAFEIAQPSQAWHRFCAPGLRPAGNLSASKAVLVPGGLFVSAGGGAFRFNLDTPYCD